MDRKDPFKKDYSALDSAEDLTKSIDGILQDFYNRTEIPSFEDMKKKGNAASEKQEEQSAAENRAEAAGKEPAAEGRAEAVSEEAKQEEEPEKTLEELLEELDGLVGLESVKADVHSLINFIKINKLREERGMKVPTISYHLVFTGNPGTGKTTIARLIAKLYHSMGILPKGQLVEVDRSALVGGYLGQTAIKTKEAVDSAMGGVLFVDEAYSLANDDRDSYGKEAIETILKAMEDHRDELVVIVAGYDELMHKFIDSNPGLQSRFSKYFHFPDYTGEEMLKIFDRYCASNGYRTEEEAEAELAETFGKMYEDRDENFGNARTVRNIFEKAIHCQANRLAADSELTDEELQLLTIDDVREAINREDNYENAGN